VLVEPPATRADLRWRMLGMPIRVHPWFWIAPVMMGLHGMKDDLDSVLVWVAVVFVSVLVHELGHALVARAFGAKDTRIVLYSFGGLAIHSGGLKRWQRIVELLAGPGAGFVLAGLAFAALELMDITAMSRQALYALVALKWVGLIWGVMNLMPVFPLDGGQVAHELILSRRPLDGLALSFRFGALAGAIVAGVCGVLWWRGLDLGVPTILFALLALNNWMMLRAVRSGLAGDGGGWGEMRPREAWEQDPDWWKGS
jgi:stage IV sporulation protein FB